ncbi:tRNA-binding protein [Candidatus Roizmanbacteria bacterium CG10_big_fil_rev_8_21_14_0_10_45_7]|uniref:Methionine--tRNA ligase n=1 Tax=Candidatus Roizmanbacteria bacterium CG10_big_fil_rev_8_21_14_0_10_45_7 TaxID=1974854 RepID=A0A2M8KVF6_9BACT|nr:MAG: tRNA-binding protein [Candidatus Roizmanbacteria bacterium CG10_big_fil_rev_8_21_14_0_10_45_7]
MITIDDFSKLDIRIGTIKTCEKVEGADKLLKLMVDIGNGEERQILTGIAEYFPDISALVGKQIPVLVNLQPRLLRGLESQGMMLAAISDTIPVLLHPAQPVKNGSVIR